MAGPAYIKSEPRENHADMNGFIDYSQGFQQQYNPGVPMSFSNGMQQSFVPGSMASSFNQGNAGIADDELDDLDFPSNGHNMTEQYMFNNQNTQNLLQQQIMQQQAVGMFSHTPDAPIQSPYTNGSFNHGQFRPMAEQPLSGAHSMPQQTNFRPHMHTVDRKFSDSRSPATPHTPGIKQINIPTEDFNTFPGMHINHQRQQSSMGNGWDSTPDAHSWNDNSAFSSPTNGHIMHPQIAEVLKTAPHHHKVASSLPTKMEGGAVPGPQSQEMKRRRRRESHNQVERRRRDNINERIQDLGHLVPPHRLLDEHVRKHLQTNAPLSPSITNATELSPPNNSAALLSGSGGRRGVGAITTGFPSDEKDKGPNKGDILNGSVAWARDIMWYINRKMTQETQLRGMLQGMGQEWPFEETEDDRRMHSELCEVIGRHITVGDINTYTRRPGSGLRVPGFTHLNGDSLNGEMPSNGINQISPGFQSGGSGRSSGQMSGHAEPYWNELKEQDEEYEFDMQ